MHANGDIPHESLTSAVQKGQPTIAWWSLVTQRLVSEQPAATSSPTLFYGPVENMDLNGPVHNLTLHGPVENLSFEYSGPKPNMFTGR